MEQQFAPDRSGRKAFKITMFGCLGVVAAFILVVFAMFACTAMMSAPEDKQKDKDAKQAVADFVGASPAEAHQQVVTLHNQNDAAWTGSGHHLLVVCDGTNNGHRFGAEVKLRNGNTPIRFDFGSGSECYDDSFRSEIVAIRWVCAEGRGAWRSA